MDERRSGRTRLVYDKAKRTIVPVGNWQPIDTAPLDGTEVDLWCSNSSALTAGAGRVTDCHFHCGEWLRFGADNEIGWVRVHNATHWMSIPEGPAACESGSTAA